MKYNALSAEAREDISVKILSKLKVGILLYFSIKFVKIYCDKLSYLHCFLQFLTIVKCNYCEIVTLSWGLVSFVVVCYFNFIVHLSFTNWWQKHFLVQISVNLPVLKY